MANETDRSWQEVKNIFLDVRVGRTGRAGILMRLPDIHHQLGIIPVYETTQMKYFTKLSLNDAGIVPGPTGRGEQFIINRAMNELETIFDRQTNPPIVRAAHLAMVSLFRECGDLPGAQEQTLNGILKEYFSYY